MKKLTLENKIEQLRKEYPEDEYDITFNGKNFIAWKLKDNCHFDETMENIFRSYYEN